MAIDSTLTAQDSSTTPVLPAKARTQGIIYPVTGRNDLQFNPASCSSCGLCAFVCPTGAISTGESEAGYHRIFDLASCVFCGMCEVACPTQAIKLSSHQPVTQNQLPSLKIRGEINRAACPKCQRKAPRSDLFAGRLYRFELGGEDQTGLNLAEQEERQVQLERGKLFIQPEGVCLECQQQVLIAEEKLCELP